MLLVKVLERKGVIRFVGFSLLMAPLINTWVSIITTTQNKNHWTFKVFWRVATSGTLFDHALNIASMVIGIIMLTGSLTAWRYALAFSGIRIVSQLANFGSDSRASWISALFLFINICFFLFIADQLVFKVKARAPQQPNPNPTPNPVSEKYTEPAPKPVAARPRLRTETRTRKNILIQFAGSGPWAKLIQVTGRGIGVRGIKPPPPDLESREVELLLQEGLALKLKLTQKQANDFFFEYKDLSKDDVKRLNEWITRLAA